MSPVDDAVVDDVAVEVGQVQVADRADQQQDRGRWRSAARTAGDRSGAARSRPASAAGAGRGPRRARGPIGRLPRDRQLGARLRHRPQPDEAALQLVVREAREDRRAASRGDASSRSREDGHPGVASGGRGRPDGPSRRGGARRGRAAPSGRRCPVALATDTSSDSASLLIGSGPSPSRIVRTWRWTMLSEPCSQRRNMPIRSRGFHALSSLTTASSMASRRRLLNVTLIIYATHKDRRKAAAASAPPAAERPWASG